VTTLLPKRATPAPSAPARYDDVDHLARKALWVDANGNVVQTTKLALLCELRDSAAIELQLESDAALHNVREGYGLCLYDVDRDANALMRSAFDGPDTEIDALLRDDLDDDEADGLASEPLADGDAYHETRLRFSVEYEQSSGFSVIDSAVRIDPDELIARYRRRQLERVFVTAEERFDVHGLADYIEREDRRPAAAPRSEAGATGEAPESMRPSRRRDGEAQTVLRLSRLQELRAIHVWAGARASLVEAWTDSPHGKDYDTPEAWEADWAPDSMTARHEHLAIIHARAEAILHELDAQRAEEYVLEDLADAYAASWAA
jgi:hypothetical protein